VETDLTSERQAYLEALQDLRELRGQHTSMENEHANRTAELLATLTEAKEREEELVAALGSAQSTADLSLRKASELAERLEALEHGKSAQDAERDHNWVSRTQVEAMDHMFKETVEKLSARLEALASQNQRLAEQQEVQVALGGGPGRGGANMADRNQRLNASSRAALSDLERRHNPLRMGGGGGGGRRVGEESNGRGSGAARYGPAGGVGVGGGGRNVRIEPGKLRARGGGAVGGNPFAAPQRRF
jgi:chromosome segregation ATPase